MPTPDLSRRRALGAAAALPLAACLTGATGRPAQAAAEMKGPAAPQVYRFRLGAFEVTTLLAGSVMREDPHAIFGLDVPDERFAEVSRQNFLPTDQARFFFNLTLVNTGQELILFDTGLEPAATAAVLRQSGYAPADVDTVVITHMHGDHIGGLMGPAGETFGNARYVTGAVEHDHWSKAGGDGFAQKVAPLSEQMRFVEDGASVAPGITAMAAFGHTPGHMTYHLESDGARLLVFADTANHAVYSLAYPDWRVSFDSDDAEAAATRRRILAMLAAERMPFVGYHMPFPGLGFVEASGEGFRYVAETYQMPRG